LASHANGGTLVEAVDAVKHTAPIYEFNNVLDDLVPRSHTATGPRDTRRLPANVPYGGRMYDV